MTNLIRKSLAALLALSLALLPVTASAVDDIQDYSTTPSNNTNVGGVSMAESMLPGLVNDGVRALIAQLKRGIANRGADIASAATTNICATGTSIYAQVTGTTTITSLGTAAAGCWRIVTFTGALTLTHNATSLILPSGANITTVAGAVAGFMSEGSGNWRMIWYSAVPFLSAANTFTAAQTISLTAAGDALTLTGTDAGASAGPGITLHRNSASPAASDATGRINFDFEDSAGNQTTGASITGAIIDPTNGAERARLTLSTITNGSTVDWFLSEGGFHFSGLTEKGQGTINANGVYINGHGTVAQVVSNTQTAYSSSASTIPNDNTIPQNTEGVEILSVAITPTSASSIIRINVHANIGAAATGVGSAALFVDTTANALAASMSYILGGAMGGVDLVYEVSAGSTSARTYKVRVGLASGTVYVNGDNTARIFGGVAVSSLTVTEVLPQ